MRGFIPERLKTIISETGWTKEEFCEKTGWSKNFLYDVLRGGTEPGAEKLRNLKRATGCDLNYVLSETEELDAEKRFEVPILNQIASAGPGKSVIDETEAIGTIPILDRALRRHNVPYTSLRAVEVRGDSMTGVYLFDGDYVIYSRGLIRDDGIYVIILGGSVLVKRLEYDRAGGRVIIRSENPRYPEPSSVDIDSDMLYIEGKVLMSFHNHPY
jgi:phage repressor protein C with HTH and peptisase S24 domain